jgi:hypothetical protein
MTQENRIIEVRLTLHNGVWTVAVTKEFEAQYGGGSQTFTESGGTNPHRALDVAREMVTVSPGRRTDLPVDDNNGNAPLFPEEV